MIKNVENLKIKIEKEINIIDKSYDKTYNEINKTYADKHEKLLNEENNLKEILQNEVTKTKEKFEIFLSKCNELLKMYERIKKGLKILQNEEIKNIIKDFSYISTINKNKKKIENILIQMMKNIKIKFNEKESKLNFEEYYFNGIQTPYNVGFKDITSNSLKVFWKIE